MDADFHEWRKFKVKADKKKTTFFFFLFFVFCFCFWLTAGENIDFVTQKLADNRIFGDD